MKYRVDLSKTADKQLLKLPDKVYDRIMGRILELQDNPMPAGYKKLTAFPGYRLRVGDFRILYTIDLKKALQHIEWVNTLGAIASRPLLSRA